MNLNDGSELPRKLEYALSDEDIKNQVKTYKWLINDLYYTIVYTETIIIF